MPPDPRFKPEVPGFLGAFTKLLRTAKSQRLTRFADQLEKRFARLQHKRAVAVVLALAAFLIAIKPVISIGTDIVAYVGEHVLGWGVCYTLTPSGSHLRIPNVRARQAS